MTTLGQEKAYAGMKDPENRVVELYHGESGNCTQKRIVRRFTQPSSLRCVVATIAFGMGIQVTDVRFILHWGPSKTVLDYWQEVGRCGRDGSPAKAIMYLPPYSVNSRLVGQEMVDVCRGTACIRKMVLSVLLVRGMAQKDLASCSPAHCCCRCDREV